MIYRIKQFYGSITANVSEYERRFATSYLNKKEAELFFKLQKSEQKHCINVAADINNSLIYRDKEDLIRLALLHDIGKIEARLNPFDKAIIVILDQLTRGKLQKYTKNKKVNNYYHHPEIGSEILRQIGGYDELFLQRIKKHHTQETNDESLMILQKWDNRN